MRQYVLIAYREAAIEVWTRAEDGSWSSVVARDGDVARLTSINADVDVHELYAAAAQPTA